MKPYTLVLVAAVVAVLAAAPKNTRADTLSSNFGPHSTLTPVRRIGFSFRPKTLQPSGGGGSQFSGTPYLTLTEPKNSNTFDTSSPNNQNKPNNVTLGENGGSNWSPQPDNQNQPNNVTVSDQGGSTWFPQPSNTRVVLNPQCTPITATPEWGSTLLFLGVDLVGFVTLASLAGILRRQRLVAVQT